MKIAIKLLLGFAVIIILAVAVGVMGIVGMQSLHQAGMSMYEEQVGGLEKLNEAIGVFTNLRVNVYNAVIKSLYDDQKGALDAKNQFESNAAEFDRLLGELVTIEELRVLCLPIENLFRNVYVQTSRRILDMSIGDIPDHARKLDINALITSNAETTEHLSKMLDSITSAYASLAEYSNNSNEQLKDFSTNLQYMFLLAAIILGAALCAIITRSIVSPINRIVDTAHEISKGNLGISMKGKFTGEFKRIHSALTETVAVLNAYVAEISRILSLMAKSNLNQEITGDYSGDFKPIKDAINLIIDEFNMVVTSIRDASQQVHAGARQITDSSKELSSATSRQSDSIENLVNTMTVINQQAEKNTSNARIASELTEKSKDNAINGNMEMENMMKAINDIKLSSDNISKVTKVIEDIAFQTNILALNASVEAARAGVHGRGFSVVAEEVRNLATKSQGAARETTNLIEESSLRVDEGAKIANSTANALKTIVSDIAGMSELIGEIDNSSVQQSSLISTLNESIDWISKAVDVNLHTSGQSAEIAGDLLDQVDTLYDMVSIFETKM